MDRNEAPGAACTQGKDTVERLWRLSEVKWTSFMDDADAESLLKSNVSDTRRSTCNVTECWWL